MPARRAARARAAPRQRPPRRARAQELGAIEPRHRPLGVGLRGHAHAHRRRGALGSQGERNDFSPPTRVTRTSGDGILTGPKKPRGPG